jgi:PAS domain S-box-containing protein
MHPQLEQHLKSVYGTLESVPAGLERLLGLIDRHYHEADRERGRFVAFMDNAPTICALKDPNGILLYANKTTGKHFPQLAMLGGMGFAWLPPEISGSREEDGEVIAGGQVIETVRAVPAPGQEERHWLIYRFPVPDGNGQTLVGVSALDITERRQVEHALRRQALILETIQDAVVVTDLAGRVTGCNAAASVVFGYTHDEMLGRVPPVWSEAESEARLAEVRASIASSGRWKGELLFRRKEGAEGACDMAVVPFRDEHGREAGLIAVIRDATERRALARQVLQSQKLEAIGQLAAGIAHEINTPNQYVADNVHFLESAFGQLFTAMQQHRALLEAARAVPDLAEPLAAAEQADQAADVDYLATEVPTSIRQSLDGLKRIAEIVSGVKAFAHPGDESKTPVDLNAALEKVIMVSRNEWKYVAEIETAFDPELPTVPCFAGEIDQVFLNIIVNAAHAIGDAMVGQPGARGRITVGTRRAGDHVEIRITDTGEGIPAEVQPRIFDPFFTTKPVGKGTGQGLTISHRLVVERHAGALTFETTSGEGTTFIIRLPLDDDAEAPRLAA